MLNKTLIVAGTSALLAASADAAIVARWNFNTRSMDATTGTGTAALVGTKGLGFSAGAAADADPGTNLGLRMSNFSPSLGQSGRRGVQFTADTQGFGLLTVAFSIGGQARSSGWGQLQYSTNGGASYRTANLAGNGRFRLNADGTFRRIAFSLALIDGASDNGNFKFRIVAIADPTVGAFKGASGASMMAAAFWKLDAVTVSGTSLDLGASGNPAPGAVALLAVAGVVGLNRRRD